VLECLPSKGKTLSSNPRTAKKKKPYRTFPFIFEASYAMKEFINLSFVLGQSFMNLAMGLKTL
jgi:hypothetical protein